MLQARQDREGKRRNASACDTRRIRMNMNNNKGGGGGIDYGGRAVRRIIAAAAAAISANLIHQGKKQLRIIIDRLMEARRASWRSSSSFSQLAPLSVGGAILL